MGIGRYDWADWLMGIFAGFIGGGAGAFTSGLISCGIDPDKFNFAHPAKVAEIMLGVFVANGVVSAMAYLHQNPSPSVITVTTVQTTEKTKDPPSTKTTTVEETKVGPQIPPE